MAQVTASSAQFGEDQILGQIFSQKPGGVCVEVGAFDGVTGSATLAFEQLGWTTILVEPLPELAAKIRRARKGRLFEVAAGPFNGEVKFKRALKDPAISTLADTVFQRQLGELRQESWEEVVVQQRTLDSILEECAVSHVDFATIDVEGFEIEVLRGWTVERWKPRVIILEDNSRGFDLSVAAHLDAIGYVCFHHTGVNDWYAQATDRAIVRWPAPQYHRMRRRMRRLRQWIKEITPPSLRRVLRRTGIAGE